MILQIIPAVGWFAKFADEDEPEGYFLSPLVCWALCEDENIHGIDTADGTQGFPEDTENFIEYVLQA